MERTMERRFGVWVRVATFVLSLSLSEIDVNAILPCVNRIELLRELLPSQFGMFINASSFVSPHLPSEARASGAGWCAACNSAERQFIEVDFGAELIIEAIALLTAGGGYVTHYNVEYAGSDKVYHCISERISNTTVFDANGTCNLNMEPSDFSNPVIARYVRVIPIEWVGTSACLKMELYGCTIKDCRTVYTLRPDMIMSLTSPSIGEQVLDVSYLNYWCASASGPQTVTLGFSESVYLMQLRARSNSVSFSISPYSNQTFYQSVMGFNIFRLPFNVPVRIPLWPPINTTTLQFVLSHSVSDSFAICFAVELIGCLSGDVTDHSQDPPMPPMLEDTAGTCIRPEPTPTLSESLKLSPSSRPASTDVNIKSTSIVIVRSTSVIQSIVYVTVTNTVQVTASAMVRLSEVSTDDTADCNCNIIAIVVPIVLVIIALIVIICVNIVVIKMSKRRKEDNTTSTSINNHTTTHYVVENDLYQSQDVDKETTNTGIISQYSEVGVPDHMLGSPTASDRDDVPVYSKVADAQEYDYPTQPPLDSTSRTPAVDYEVVPEIKSPVKTNAYYSVPNIPPVAINPSYAASDAVVHNTDKQ